MLQLHQVTKTYRAGVQAVSDFSATLKPGVIGLVGHNGAGKTTLMQMIATLTKPSSGTIHFDGIDIVRQPNAIRARLGFLPQDFGVYDNITAREFLSYFAALKGVRDRKKIDELLRLVNLHEQADRVAATFSGGMRQRLGIAQALINDPDIIIVDEPTAGLDPGERLRFRNLLSEIGFHKLVIVSTHIVSDVESMASELALMDQGRLVALQAPEAILATARGKVWSGRIAQSDFDEVRANFRILHAQRTQDGIDIRVAHAQRPFADMQMAEPNLEEALMLFANFTSTETVA